MPQEEVVDLNPPAETPAGDAKNALASQDGGGGGGGEAKPQPSPASEGEGAGKAKPEGGEAPAGDEGTKDGGEPHPQGEEPSGEGKPKPKESIEARMRELTQQRREFERRAREAEQRERQAVEALTRLGRPPKEEAPKGAPAEEAKPAAPEFEGDVAKYTADMAVYTEKLADWTAGRKVKAELAEQARAKAEQEQRDHTSRIRTEYTKRRGEAIQRLPDFAEIAEAEDLTVTPTMAGGIMNAANGPDVLYHLGKNPEEAARIAGLSAGQQLMEIGAISERLKPAPGRTTRPNPPPPIKPAGPGSAAIPTQREKLEIADMDEYAKLRTGAGEARAH